jgi:Tfp pilus assembly protein PilF
MAHVCLGEVLQEQNKNSEAMTQYIMALRLDPEFDLAYSNLAKLFADEGKLELSAVYFREAVKWKPRVPLVYDNFGVVLVKLKQPDEAMKEFLAAAQLDPTAAGPHFLMGRLLLQRGQDVDAVTQLRKALELDPNNPELLIYTASVLAADENQKVRNGADACVLAEKAIKLTNGQQPAAFDAVAMSNAESGRFGAAALFQMQAIKLAEAMGQDDDLAVMQQRLQLYQKNQPCRESFKAN